MKTVSKLLAAWIFLSPLINALGQPIITRQPTNQSVSLGASAKFQVSATSINPPILFQWRLATTNMPRATSSSLTLTNIQIINAGDYDAVGVDSSGSVTSRVATLDVDPIFSKITQGDMVNDLGGFVRGIWGDFNNDGFLDLYVNNYGGTNVLYQNNRDGSFAKITQGGPVQGSDNHTIPSWIDFDNDGNLDLLVPAGLGAAPTTSHIHLFHNNGDATFTSASAGDLTGLAGYFGWGTVADYDNDGFVDVLISNIADVDVGGTNVLFHNNGDGTFRKATANPVTSDNFGIWGMVWADYDNDGFMDLFVASHFPNTVNRLYHNDHNGKFTRVLTNIVASEKWPAGDSGGNGGAAWGDYDNDGFLDLFVYARHDSPNRLYHNNGDGSFSKISSGPILSHAPGAQSSGCAWGDFDNDGYLDLFVASINGRNGFFHNNGDGNFTQILSGSPVNDGAIGISYGAPSWADYDSDGFLDLFVAGGPTDTGLGKNFLYHNNGNSNAWLEVRCVGTVSNRSAIGAKVRVRATIAGKTLWQLREINEGGGHNSAPLVAHFGLGDATNVDLLRIEWPSGYVQEITDVPARQIKTVIEAPRLSASITNGAAQLVLRGGRGFNYAVESSEDFKTWLSLGNVTLTNLNGTASITDTNTSGASHRFYRALQIGQ